jgi:hypothetical protein
MHLHNAIVILCCNTRTGLSLSDLSDISQIIIAIINLLLAGYIFFYQIKKDKKLDIETTRLNEQSIKLQWFKELIVQPNIKHIDVFYVELHSIKGKINNNDLSIVQKEDINNFVKAELAIIRKSFIDVLMMVDKNFANQVLNNLDGLVDEITNAIFNDELKLNLPNVYEKQIGSKISYSKNNLIAQLYNYKGAETFS